MTNHRLRHPGLLTAAAILLAAGAAGAQGWWNPQWPYRRMLTVPPTPASTLPGDEVAVVTMLTAGLVGPGGADIRVVTANNTLLASRVLMMGPGDRVTVAFALRPGTTAYGLYFGHPTPPKNPPVPDLDIRRGLLLETWAYAGGPITTFEQVQATLQRARQLIGREFRDTVFLGHNPFGPQDRLCSLFTGHIVCPEAGQYTFATASRDASFLTVDGKLVVSNGGRHGPQRRATNTGKINLTKGLHELKVYHVTPGGDPVIMAAWQPPGGDRLWTIPDDAFAPVRVADPGVLTQYGGGLQADFLSIHAGESFMDDQYFQRHTFRADAAGTAPKPTFRWDFGDGQTAEGVDVQHVYLRDGLYKVTLTAKQGTQTVKRSNRIVVTRPWDQVTVNRLDPVAEHARIVAGYDFGASDPADIAPAIELLERARKPKDVLRAGDALVKWDSAPAAVLARAMPIYAKALVEAGDPARAVASLVKSAGMDKDPAVAADLTVRAGRTALEAGETDKALGLFNEAIRRYSALTTAPAIREARIGIGDVWRVRADLPKAAQAYESAGTLLTSTFEKSAVRKGDLSRHAEDYIRQGQLTDAEDFLVTLEYEFPAERLEGFSTLLWVRLELARKRPAAAAAAAESLVRVNPRSNYAPELLMKAAEAYAAQRQDALARQTFQRVIDGYPESPLAADARKKLAKP
ncbi:MAG TPA: tetratricopeptide repeat protein [Phycisphaerae bacterium]|nr:tetratricopeptide repeat protein [Phycisphaerae bacterium]